MGSRSLASRPMLTPPQASRAPDQRSIASESQWTLSDVTCTAGPRDKPFEERHERVSIALVISGTFRYRTDAGQALLYPGSILLGNGGACFECGHEHAAGDRCLALHIRPDLFAEAAFAAAGAGRFRFRSAMVPAVPELTAPSTALRHAPTLDSGLAIEEAVIDFLDAVIVAHGADGRTSFKAPPAALRRLPKVFDYINSRFTNPIGLAELSGVAAMSKYHFLRTFKRTSGVTPHQYILGRRMQEAAAALRRTKKPISAIALEQGFGDLSTFNHAFRRVMGMTPTEFRKTA